MFNANVTNAAGTIFSDDCRDVLTGDSRFQLRFITPVRRPAVEDSLCVRVRVGNWSALT
jgi:hypothetical protein